MPPRSMWKGAISFGLVTIPVAVYPATEEKSLKFNQLHDADMGRIRYKRVCSVDGEEVWCSPEYLKLEQSRGRLILAPEHWELRNPNGYMKRLLADAHAIVKEYNDMAERLGYEETIAIISHSSNPADAR